LELPKSVEKKMRRIIVLYHKQDVLRREVEDALVRLGVNVSLLRENDAHGLTDALDYGIVVSLEEFKNWFDTRAERDRRGCGYFNGYKSECWEVVQ
jgi:hypothetical protein